MKKLQTTQSTDRENLENVSVLALSPPASAITMCNILLFYHRDTGKIYKFCDNKDCSSTSFLLQTIPRT